MPNPPQNPLFQALTSMLMQSAKPSSTYVDAPYVAQQQQRRQQNAFEQAKQEDYYNKVQQLNGLRAQGTNPSQMFQKANNFVGDFVTGNNTQQMMENVALNAIPLGKMLMAIAPFAKTGDNIFYHGSNVKNIEKLRTSPKMSWTDRGAEIVGVEPIWLTQNKHRASVYGKNLYTVRLSENAKVAPDDFLQKYSTQDVQKMGFDAAYINDGNEKKTFIVFNPEVLQILK